MNVLPSRRGRRPTGTLVREFTVVIHPNDGGAKGYWGEVPAVPGVSSRGETVDQAVQEAREALTYHLEWLLDDGAPLPDDLPFTRKQRSQAAIRKVQVTLARR